MTDSAIAGRITTSFTPPALSEFVSAWRSRAADLRRWAAAEGAACAWERAADELEARLAQEGDQVLTVAQAAALSHVLPVMECFD